MALGSSANQSPRKVAIHCPDRIIFEKVVEYLQHDGKNWIVSEPKEEWLEYWDDDGVETCVSVSDRTLSYSRKKFYQSQGITVVSFQDYLQLTSPLGQYSNSGLSMQYPTVVYSSLQQALATGYSSSLPLLTPIVFDVGDVVFISIECTYSNDLRNPRDTEGEVIGIEELEGKQRMRVKWQNGQTNGLYYVKDLMKKSSKKPKEIPKLDESKLDPLIIDESIKKEITAVLKQHEHSVKIFEEWGLGEVIEYGRGMTFMFYGPPGTGKTWGATCIAKAMGRELLIIGAAEIQSQEPGGANRNIQAAVSSS